MQMNISILLFLYFTFLLDFTFAAKCRAKAHSAPVSTNATSTASVSTRSIPKATPVTPPSRTSNSTTSGAPTGTFHNFCNDPDIKTNKAKCDERQDLCKWATWDGGGDCYLECTATGMQSQSFCESLKGVCLWQSSNCIWDPNFRE